MEQNTLTKITERADELQPLYDRMDDDREDLYLTSHTMKGIAGPNKNKALSDVANTTMNWPGVYATAIIAILMSACENLQVTVEGLTDAMNGKLERFRDDVTYTTDQGIAKRRLGSLAAWLCAHVSIRGPVIARNVYTPEGLPSHLPVDARFCPWRDDGTDIVWIAPHWKTTGVEVLKDYGKGYSKFLGHIKESDKNVDKYEYWDKDQQELWIGGEKIRELENPYRFVPFVLDAPTGYMLQDPEDWLEHWGESIFALSRGLVDGWNDLMTLLQTKAYEAHKPTYTHESAIPAQDKQKYPPPNSANIAVAKGELPELLQKPDMSRFFEAATRYLGIARQQGTLSDAELGDVSLDRTAVWITAQSEIRLRALRPRLQTIERFLIAMFAMDVAERNLHKFSDPKPIGRPGNSRIYTVGELPDPSEFTISFKLVPDNPQQRLADISIGKALEGSLSEETIMGDYYHIKDVEKELTKKAAEMARKSNPASLYRYLTLKLLDQAKKLTGDEAEQMRRDAEEMADNMVLEIHKARMTQEQVGVGGTREMLPQKGNTQGLLTAPQMFGGRPGGNGRQEVANVA